MRKNATAKALIMSVLSLMLCLSMLVGTTFAWFTDSVKSGVNKIVAGNLDVELEYTNDPADTASWTKVTETTNMFKEGALWEPGYTEVVYLRVKNAGTLALQYRFGINVAKNNFNGTSQPIDLSKYIKFGVKETEVKFKTRTEAWDAVKDTAGLISAGYASEEGYLTKGSTSKMLALVVYMPEDVGNEANHATGMTAPEIDLGINLVATQHTVESDSFGTDYDGDAKYPEAEGGSEDWYESLTISTAAHLIDLAARVNAGETFEGKTITLANDIVLDGVSNWVPIGTSTNPFMGTFDGADHTVSHFFFDQTTAKTFNYAGFFGSIYNATIQNLTVEGSLKATAYANAAYSCGGICGYAAGISTIQNCVSKVDIDGTNVADNADSLMTVGGILGMYASNDGGGGNKITIDNCTNYGDITVGNENLEEAMCIAGGIAAVKNTKLDIKSNCINNGTVSSAGNNSMHDAIAVDFDTI